MPLAREDLDFERGALAAGLGIRGLFAAAGAVIGLGLLAGRARRT